MGWNINFENSLANSLGGVGGRNVSLPCPLIATLTLPAELSGNTLAAAALERTADALALPPERAWALLAVAALVRNGAVQTRPAECG